MTFRDMKITCTECGFEFIELAHSKRVENGIMWKESEEMKNHIKKTGHRIFDSCWSY